MAEPKLTLDEAMALMDKHAAEADAKKTKKPTKKEKVKELMLQGAKQGRAGLNYGASRQLKLLEEEGY